MKFLFFIVVLLIAYGSLFPFEFELQIANDAAVDQFLTSWSQISSRGDIFANIALFLPFGYLGIKALYPCNTRASQVFWILTVALLFAVALQVLQLVIPSRVANLGDALWNVLGAALGATLAVLRRRSCSRPRFFELPRGAEVPAILLVSWVSYRLMPFVPGIDLQLLKDSLKPLLLQPQISVLDTFHDFSAWLAVFLLAAAALPGRRSDFLVMAAIPIIFALEVVIVGNWVSASNVLGAMAAVACWLIVLRNVETQKQWAAGLLAFSVVIQGLFPLEMRHAPVGFGWIPFTGFLEGSMFLNTQVLFEKVFFYGTIIWLLRHSTYNPVGSATVVVILLTAVEVSQIYFGGHTPEITDPLLAILIATALQVMESRRSANC